MSEGSVKSEKVTFILGAGFSKCADLPIQAEFSSLLTSSEFNSPLDQEINGQIKAFLKTVFGWNEKREIPPLEDVFTFIDLSIMKGHFLGHAYSAETLRDLRKILVYRIFQILDKQFNFCPEILDLLKHYLKNDCSFVVINWDIVLEKHLLEIDPDMMVNYTTPSFEWNAKEEQPGRRQGVKICKMHGSSNWVYCENCKALFYQLDKKLSLHKKVGLKRSAYNLFDPGFAEQYFGRKSDPDQEEHCCKHCGNMLSSHIATFSYRKSFRTAAYSAIWHEAENLLAQADHWIFIGYSLPEADFEFKHLIKSAELRMPDRGRRRIDAVLFQDEKAKNKFERFFGFDNVRVYENGLKDYVRRMGEF